MSSRLSPGDVEHVAQLARLALSADEVEQFTEQLTVILDHAQDVAALDLEAEGSPALEGRKLFKKLQCAACHTGDAKARGPNLAGLYGRSAGRRGGCQIGGQRAHRAGDDVRRDRPAHRGRGGDDQGMRTIELLLRRALGA